MPPITRRSVLAGGAGAAVALGAWPGSAWPAPDLVPRRTYFRDPDRRSPRLSFNGEMLAWLEPRGGVLNVVVAKLDDLAHSRQVTHATHRSVDGFSWAYTDKHIVFFQDDSGDENYQPFCATLDTGDIKALLPGGKARSFIQQRARAMPTAMLFGHNARDPRFFDLIRVDVTTGETRPVFQNPGFQQLYTTLDFTVRFGRRYAKDGSAEILIYEPDGRWDSFAAIPAEDAFSTWLEGLSFDGRSAFLVDSRGRDKAALVEIDIATRESRVLAEDAEADIIGSIKDPATNRPWAATSVGVRRRWRLVDPGFAFDLDHVQAIAPEADLGFVSVVRGHGGIVTAADQPEAATAFSLYDRSSQSTTPLFLSRDDLGTVGLRPMQAVTIPASDGVPLPGYLTLPTDGFRSGPLVLLVHGGPYTRDAWGYSSYHQWLANRGYAVLSVNYRGSTGYGKHFVALADKGWGGRMQDDLNDAARWAVGQGYADPARIGFFGESYGGYAALAAATQTPELFACIVDAFGPSNLVTLMRNVPAYWSPWFSTWKLRLADPDTEDGRAWLTAHSPIAAADRIVRPLLIAQGLRDVRVTPDESRTIVDSMRERGQPVTYITFADEGHGFGRAENRLAYAAVTEAFLAVHLGGSAEPVGDALANSSIRIEAGRDLIPGLG